MNRIFTFLLLLGLSGQTLRAQCIQLLPGCGLASDTVCDQTVNDPQLWNENYWLDPVHDLHDLAEAPSNLLLTVVDTCAGAAWHFRYLLLLDLDGDGVKETAVDSDNLPPTGAVWFGNAQFPGYAGGTLQNFDGRPVVPDLKYRFALDTTVGPGDTITAALRWNNAQAPGNYVLPQLPLGYHQIRWMATNGLGDTVVCERNFLVRDCKAPTVFCFQNLSVNIQPTGLITLWASDFLQYAEDNITPPTPYNPNWQQTYSIRLSGQGTGFPLDNFGQPITQVTFNCDQVGLQTIELWVRDASWNAAFCEAVVIVQTGLYECGPFSPSPTVCAKNYCNNEAVDNVLFEFNGTPPNGLPPIVPAYGDSLGCYTINLAWPLSTDYTITPQKDDNHSNGVSTFDLVLMSKHVLGIDPLNSPYKIIAADVNKSNSITTFDIVELRKLVLGVYNELPNNTSWRFINEEFMFSNPQNPFASVPFKENSTVGDGAVDFVAIKIGDLNCSAVANSLRPNGLLLPERFLEPGEVADIPITLAESAGWLGLQFALDYDPEVLTVEQVIPGALPDLTDDNFGLFPGRVAASWSGAWTEQLDREQPLFSLRVRARQPIALSEAFRLNDETLAPEAYTDALERQSLRLVFQSDKTAAEGPQVFAAQPNPTQAGTAIPLSLSAPASAMLTVFDGNGKKVYEFENQLDEGFQTIEIPAEAMPQSGVYYWRLSLSGQVFTGRIIRL